MPPSASPGHGSVMLTPFCRRSAAFAALLAILSASGAPLRAQTPQDRTPAPEAAPSRPQATGAAPGQTPAPEAPPAPPQMPEAVPPRNSTAESPFADVFAQLAGRVSGVVV